MERFLEEIKKELEVLNLVINGLPSIQTANFGLAVGAKLVLNLVINGLPSIFQKIEE